MKKVVKKPVSTTRIRFKHIRAEKAGITVAYTYDGGKIVIGLGFCSPKENQYSKETGREAAMFRLYNDPITVKLDGKTLHKMLFGDFLHDVVLDFAKSRHISWVEKEIFWMGV
jgi:hypothetical protein